MFGFRSTVTLVDEKAAAGCQGVICKKRLRLEGSLLPPACLPLPRPAPPDPSASRLELSPLASLPPLPLPLPRFIRSRYISFASSSVSASRPRPIQSLCFVSSSSPHPISSSASQPRLTRPSATVSPHPIPLRLPLPLASLDPPARPPAPESFRGRRSRRPSCQTRGRKSGRVISSLWSGEEVDATRYRRLSGELRGEFMLTPF